jgi:sulfoxide reductase catalytic subunit YedY
MLIKRPADITPSEITSESVYLGRRELLALLGMGAMGLSACADEPAAPAGPDPALKWAELPNVQRPSPFDTDETLTSFGDVTSYNNYYEFGTRKDDPAKNAQDFQPRPWQLRISGECANPGHFDLDDYIAPHQLEERIYRMRCVEAWSMVVPWVGIPLAKVIAAAAPTGNAKYVAFHGLKDASRMPGQRFAVLDWPYEEGLRMDEAMHPLSLLVVGVYGRQLPNQNGAPLRLIVPWKYGFKSVKSIVRIRFTEREPRTAWNVSAPYEYGFYANVNPAVDHPRWSQAKERRIGTGFFATRTDTLPFNGYAADVAGLYKGMDLRRYF